MAPPFWTKGVTMTLFHGSTLRPLVSVLKIFKLGMPTAFNTCTGEGLRITHPGGGGGYSDPPPPTHTLSRLLEDVGTASGKGIDVVYLMVLIVLHFKPL